MAGLYIHQDPIGERENIDVVTRGLGMGASAKAAANGPARGKGKQAVSASTLGQAALTSASANRAFGTDVTRTGGHNPSVRPSGRGRLEMKQRGPQVRQAPAAKKNTRLSEDLEVEVMHGGHDLTYDSFADVDVDIALDVQQVAKPRMRFKRAKGKSRPAELRVFEDQAQGHGELGLEMEKDMEPEAGGADSTFALRAPALPDYVAFDLPDLDELDL